MARGFNVQATRTLSPRWFAAARASRASAPILTIAGEPRRSFTSVDANVGYRLTTELTLRGGFETSRRYSATGWDPAAVMSIVWAERWW